jgi:DNA-binding beta-propeller fold protein YncE
MNPAVRATALALLLLAGGGAAFAQDEKAPAEGKVEYTPLFMFNQHLYYGTFNRPRGVAIDREHGEVWVADSGNGLIGIYQPNGAEIFSFGSRQYLRDPARIAIAPKGSVVIVEGDRTHVRLFSYRGEYKGDLKLPGIGDKPIIGALAYDGDGQLFVAENRSSQIFVYRPDGTLKMQFGSRGTDDGQFRSVCGIAVDASGTIYVADAQALAVQIFDSQGNFLRGWGRHEMGAENFSLPSAIAVDSKGHVIVTDELRHQVKIFNSEGKFLGQFGGLGDQPGELAFPSDVAVDGQDRIYVVERQTARIQVFDPASVSPPPPSP